MKRLFKPLVTWILTLEARLVLARYKPRIIAVTGNMGKTSTKDATFAALSDALFVRKSEKSLNSDIGVPLTILGCESGWDNPLKWLGNIFEGLALIVLKNHYPRWLILEVGADRPGDIKRITRWLKPDIAVITGISRIPVHIEYFSSPEEVAAEKRALAEALKPDGSLILNGDDEYTYAMRSDFRGAAVTYGFEDHNDVIASRAEVFYADGKPHGMHFRVDYEGSSVPVEVHGSIGRTHVYPALAALAVGVSAGLNLVSMSSPLSRHTPPPGRMRLLAGCNDSVLIDDTYNASPAATLSAVETLASLKPNGRKIAMLGDMLELGKHSSEAHRKVGELVAKHASLLVTVGMRARVIAEAARTAGLPEGRIRRYEEGESEQAGKELAKELQAGDIVVVKGSQGMRMERAVKAMLAEPEHAPELLVRQNAEWLQR